VFIHPKSGSYPGVLVWPDVFGLRPAMRDIGKRLAAQGYSVLVPNPFYRVGKTPFPDASVFNFKDSMDMKQLGPLMATAHAPGNVEKDALAHIAFLDAQRAVDTKKKIGTQGYCMGGPMVVRTAAAGTGPSRRGRVVPWRRTGHRHSRQPALAGAEDQSSHVFRHCGERRRAPA